MPRTRAHRNGFSLVEILLALAIFGLGGVAILSLFVSQVRNAEEAAEMNRCLEIGEGVRASLEASLLATPVVLWTDRNQSGFRKLYPFAFPFASLRPHSPLDDRAIVPTAEELQASSTAFFELPRQPYTGETSPPEAYTFLPRQLLDAKGNPAPIEDPGQSSNTVWYMKPTIQTASGKSVLGQNVDLDDRNMYAFMLVIRKSVARSDVDDFTGNGKMRLDELYVAQLRIFKGFDPRSANNTPIRTLNFTLVAAE